MNFKNIVVKAVDGGVGVVTLNRPQVLNALSYDLKSELDDALTAFENDSQIGAIVITGAGEKAFSAGADIHEMVDLTPEQAALRDERKLRFAWHVANCKLPTIGAINGLAYGGAALLSSSLDIRIGCERSKFRFLAAQYGRLNSTWTLPLVVGWARAKELIYTARVVEAEEAARIGLLNKVVSSDKLLDAAIEMGRQIAKNVPSCVQGAKALLNEDIGRSWKAMQQAEEDAIAGELKPPPVEVGFAEFLARKGHK
jgi:enoyl-CoA hydratase